MMAVVAGKGTAAEGWPWMAVEISQYVHLIYTVFLMAFMAHVITIIIFSCFRKKDKKIVLSDDKPTGSISWKLPQNQSQTPQQQPATPKSNDKITSNEKDNKEKAAAPAASSTAVVKLGNELPLETTQQPSKDTVIASEKNEKKMASKKDIEKPPVAAAVAKPKEHGKPQASHSSNLKADQERSNYRGTMTSNSKVSGATGETKAIRSGEKTDATQSETSKTQSSKKNSRSKRSKGVKKGK